MDTAGEFEVVGVRLGVESAAALSSFSAKVGVPREHVVSVMIALAEKEHRERDGAMVLARLLLACRDALPEQVGLRAEIDLALGQFEVPTLF